MKTDKRTIGVNITDSGEAELRVWAPNAKEVAVKVNDARTIPLQQQKFGYWHVQTADLKSGDNYQLIIDGKALPDPASLSQPNGVHGPSQAIDLSFEWTDGKWKNLPLENYIIYELHTGTFSPEGTFEGIEAKLDYLKKLGVNAIEIMPVAQFPGGRNWGYDGVYPYAVQNTYGGPKGLQQLVDKCHKKGIAVVLDVVYNHLGPEGNYFNEFGPYFTDKYNTPWGNALNFDDANCDPVREYFTQNVLMWFRDFHIDALRMDAVHAIKDFSAEHILSEIKLHVNQLMKNTGCRNHLIIECDLNDVRFINPQNKGGFGMDAQWIDEFHHALRVTAGGDTNGYYSDFTGISHLTKAYNDAYVYDGQYSTHRQKRFGSKAVSNPGQQFIVFSQNHDQVGNRMLGERSSQLFSFEMQKLMAGAVLAAPFLPMLFMGEEWSEPNPFLYFVSHTDPELAEAVRKGRKAEFAAFHAEGEAPDPNDEQTFNQSKLQWHILDEEPHKTMLSYYQALIGLRKQLAAVANLNRKQTKAECSEADQTLTLHRWYEGQYALCLMNFSAEERTVKLPDTEKQWAIRLDSASPEWKGPRAAPKSAKAGETITLQPESFLIYVNT